MTIEQQKNRIAVYEENEKAFTGFNSWVSDQSFRGQIRFVNSGMIGPLLPKEIDAVTRTLLQSHLVTLRAELDAERKAIEESVR